MQYIASTCLRPPSIARVVQENQAQNIWISLWSMVNFSPSNWPTVKQRLFCCLMSLCLILLHCPFFTANRPHEPFLSSVFKLSAVCACSHWEEWRSGWHRAVALPQSLGEVSPHLPNQATYTLCHGDMSCQPDNKMPPLDLRQCNEIFPTIPKCPGWLCR